MSIHDMTFKNIHDLVQKLIENADHPLIQKILNDCFDPSREDQQQQKYTDQGVQSINQEH
jgi:hypothetical protein